jgi:hypothetical protein
MHDRRPDGFQAPGFFDEFLMMTAAQIRLPDEGFHDIFLCIALAN